MNPPDKFHPRRLLQPAFYGDIFRSPITKAIVGGAVGGALFAWMRMPLAWMLGAMFVTTIAAFSGVQVAMSNTLRQVMIAILGVMLGASFTPELIHRVGDWFWAVLLLMAVLTVLTSVTYFILRKIGKYDPLTAYFSSTPGGLSTMAITGEDAGADVRAISITHATRILIVVMVIPFYFRVIEGLHVPSQPANSISLFHYPWAEAPVLILCGILGVPLAKLLRLPAAWLFGPVILSATAHLSGISHSPPPMEFVAAAQIIIGAAIGARFAGVSLSEVWRLMVMAAGSAIVMIAIAAVISPFAASALNVDPAALFLALVPGGLTEMSLIALSLGVDTAFVSTMHIIRIVAIMGLAPLLYHWYAAREKRAGA